MSLSEPVDAVAFQELEVLVRALGEELSRFRKRALSAEARLKQIQESGGGSDLFTGDRLATLEAENQELRSRLDEAANRTRATLERVRFLRQQEQRAAE